MLDLPMAAIDFLPLAEILEKKKNAKEQEKKFIFNPNE